MKKIPFSESGLSLTRMAEFVPEIRAAHERDSERAEYGVNWYEWINTTNSDHVDCLGLTRAWWDAQSVEYQLEVVTAQLQYAKQLLYNVTNALNKMKG